MDITKLQDLKKIVDQGEKIEKHNKELKIFKETMNHPSGMGFTISCYPSFVCHQDHRGEYNKTIGIDSDIILEHLEEMINKQIERNQNKFDEL